MQIKHFVLYIPSLYKLTMSLENRFNDLLERVERKIFCRPVRSVGSILVRNVSDGRMSHPEKDTIFIDFEYTTVDLSCYVRGIPRGSITPGQRVEVIVQEVINPLL